jgi:Tol biopolymer transport system component
MPPVENEFLGDVQWSPQGEAIAYLSTRETASTPAISIRTSALPGGRPIVVVSGPFLAVFSWLPSGRLIYARFDSDPTGFGGDGNLWDVPVDTSTGRPSGRPRELTQWAGFRVEDLSSTVDGIRLALMRRTGQCHSYVGQLDKDGTRMQPPRRLTFSEAQDWPFAWTADSKAVIFMSDRKGRYEIFKQGLDQERLNCLPRIYSFLQFSDSARMAPGFSIAGPPSLLKGPPLRFH